MTLKSAASAVIVLLLAGPALASPEPGAQTTGPVTRSTLFSPVPRSLQQLIGDGYEVVNIAIGLTGFGYLLKLDKHYVTCAVQPDGSHPGLFVSECRAMN